MLRIREYLSLMHRWSIIRCREWGYRAPEPGFRPSSFTAPGLPLFNAWKSDFNQREPRSFSCGLMAR